MVNWNADADAKLLLGVLNQFRDAKLTLDYKELAKFMGGDCVAGAVQNRIKRLRRKAEESSTSTTGDEAENAPDTPPATPQKRKAGRSAGTSAKKAKTKTEEQAPSE